MPAVIYPSKVVEPRYGRGAAVFSQEYSDQRNLSTGTDRPTHPSPLRAKGHETRDDTLLARDLKGRALVTMDTGEKLGVVDEVLFHPEKLKVAGLAISKGGLFDRETDVFPADSVRVWGIDVILVDPAPFLSGPTQGDLSQWIKLSDQLQGRYVVSTDGIRIGQVNDLIIDQRGHVVAYDLAQVFIDGPLAESKRIPVLATSSLGRDVLIVDREKF